MGVLVTNGLICVDSETYSESSQTPKMELFAKIDNDWKPSTILTKSSILDVWLDSECSSEIL